MSLRFSCLSLLCAVVALAVMSPAMAQPQEFEGRVEALHRAELASQLNGIVARVLFEGGEAIAAGEALIELDDAEFKISVAAAVANIARAKAQQWFAEQKAVRVRNLSSRGVATEAEKQLVEAALATSNAEVAIAETALQRAELNLARAVIRAPIDGLISRPSVAPGTFLEAVAGPPLATIIQLDPILVTYSVRLDTMERTEVTSLKELFEKITLQLVLPNGQIHPHTARPRFASSTVDANSGAMMVWAQFDNPAGTLRPGMSVRVLSTLEN